MKFCMHILGLKIGQYLFFISLNDIFFILSTKNVLYGKTTFAGYNRESSMYLFPLQTRVPSLAGDVPEHRPGVTRAARALLAPRASRREGREGREGGEGREGRRRRGRGRELAQAQRLVHQHQLPAAAQAAAQPRRHHGHGQRAAGLARPRRAPPPRYVTRRPPPAARLHRLPYRRFLYVSGKEKKEKNKKSSSATAPGPPAPPGAGGGEKEAKSAEEKRKHIKSLIDKIPTQKEQLFQYKLDTAQVRRRPVASLALPVARRSDHAFMATDRCGADGEEDQAVDQ